MTSQGHDGPGRVGFHVPHLDRLVVRPTHYPLTVKLDAADAPGVPLEGPHVGLASHPGALQLPPLHEHLLPLRLPPAPSFQLGGTTLSREFPGLKTTKPLPEGGSTCVMLPGSAHPARPCQLLRLEHPEDLEGDVQWKEGEGVSTARWTKVVKTSTMRAG